MRRSAAAWALEELTLPAMLREVFFALVVYGAVVFADATGSAGDTARQEPRLTVTPAVMRCTARRAQPPLAPVTAPPPGGTTPTTCGRRENKRPTDHAGTAAAGASASAPGTRYAPSTRRSSRQGKGSAEDAPSPPMPAFPEEYDPADPGPIIGTVTHGDGRGDGPVAAPAPAFACRHRRFAGGLRRATATMTSC